MPQPPGSRKPDRYKASSYRTYNFRAPARYDDSVWMAFCQTPLWDRTIAAELGSEIARLAILDVGCATGRLLASLAAAGAERLAGTDLAPKILDVAREKLAAGSVAADLRTADAEDALPWPAASFDVATLTGVLHHFTRPTAALREIARVLRPGGRLLVIDPAFLPGVRQVINLALRIAPHEGDFRFYSRTRAAALLGLAGLQTSHSRRVGLWSYFVAAVTERSGQA
jgi:ubiquinone/menaquinone biosynthesis C-methylase UbiE